jgi:hypothetical protein
MIKKTVGGDSNALEAFHRGQGRPDCPRTNLAGLPRKLLHKAPYSDILIYPY